MAKTVADLGNGRGFIYVTEKNGTSIVENIANNAEGARKALQLATSSVPIGADGSTSFSITITSISAGSDVTSITIGGKSIMSTTVAYSGTAAALASSLASQINSDKTNPEATAYAYSNVIYVTLLDAGTTYNGSTVVVNDASSTVYTVTEPTGGSDNDDSDYHTSFGYRFYLDADYGTGSCSGDGEAAEGDNSNATEITGDVVPRPKSNTGFRSETVTISSGSVSPTRADSVTFLNVRTELGAADDLDNIQGSTFYDGDIIILYNIDGFETTVRDGQGNIELAANDNFVSDSKDDVLGLYWNDTDQTWYELWRSGDRAIGTGSIQSSEIAAGAITTSELANKAVTAAKLADLTVTAPKIATDAITTNKIKDGNVTAEKVETVLKTDLVVIYHSFETNEQGDLKIELPYSCTVDKIVSYASKTVAGTDDGTLTYKDDAGNTMGTQTVSASTAIGSGPSDVSPTTNNVFTANETMTVTSSKSTAGGRMVISIHVTKT